MSDQSTIDHKAAIADLEKQLAATSRATRPHEHAVLAYRLGLAYAELPTGNPAEQLRKALAFYDVAAAIFDPRFEPVHHARVLNAAGAAHRALNNRPKAAELFEKAVALFAEGGSDNERAAAYNNLGLTRTEMGQPQAGVEAFDAAVELFDAYTDEGKRGIISTLHNRGQAHTALGTEEGLEAALADFEEARGMIDPDENPLHHGMVEHSVGVTCSALAEASPEGKAAFLKEAIRAFNNSLLVFTRTAFPYYHALVKHNLGLAHEAQGGTANLRRALASFEDAVGVFDTRLHADAWKQAYASLERVENALKETAPGKSRTDHFAALLTVVDVDERTVLVRERVFRLLALPEPRRTSSIAELTKSVGELGYDEGRKAYETIVKLFVELPQDQQSVGLRAIIAGHRSIDDEDVRLDADRAVDQAIGDALGGPQRVSVRDFMEGEGWERP
ncbi:MAG TPA: tetratricopeptide repeat protein [Acidimicrobiales bacterium]|nr:tetratricopeptide repeat protein [Acidimicrobiales bacterium]